MAAAAALARLEQEQSRALGSTSQDSIRNQVRKEIQAEATYSNSGGASRSNLVPEPKEEISLHLAVPGMYFICPLLDVTLKRDQRDAHIKEAILSHFSTDPVAASIMKIYLTETGEAASGYHCQVPGNIHFHPEEERY